MFLKKFKRRNKIAVVVDPVMNHQIVCLALVVLFCSNTNAAKKIPVIPEMFILDSQIMVNDQYIQFDILNIFELSDGRILTRYQQSYENIPVWGKKVTVSVTPGRFIPIVTGEVVSDINSDLASTVPEITGAEAVSIAIDKVMDDIEGRYMADEREMANVVSRNQQPQLWIYIDKTSQAHLAYMVSWTFKGERPSRPIVFVDAQTGVVVDSWNGLARGDNELSRVAPDLNKRNWGL